ncbi:MAG TPA: hypothetical protein VMU43_11020 [Candidatus Acidoferrum sp.]|nr:hypothetical protein [Candidatus Acidoferrum sp.]
MRASLPSSRRLLLLPAAFLLFAPFLPSQDHTAELAAKFDRETNPVHKAKLMPDLGNGEFQEIQTQAAAGNYEAALKTLALYHNQVAATEKALDATGADPAKHSSGYRQLEISVREALRRLDDIDFSLPVDQKKAFTDIHDQLQQTDQRLLRELFPRDHPPATSPAAPHP